MRIGRWLAAGIAVALVVQLGSAQAPRGFGGGFGGSLFLLSQKSVQDELKLSEEQTKKLTTLQEKQREGRASFKGFKDLSDEEKKAKIQEFAKQAQERAKEADKAIAEILKPEQLKRFKQISLQQRGAGAISDPEVAEALKLTDEQKGKVKDINESLAKDAREAGRGEDGRKKREELRKSADEKVMAILSEEQKTKLKELGGEPFKGEIKRPEFRPRNKQE
jgi:Spy/CpxP family protein refolding chaperone